jgi:hypothetical protein
MVVLALVASLGAAPAAARGPQGARVTAEWVKAHEAFLAGDALRGRGSATHDEAVAAAYVASQFEGFGLKTAPGMSPRRAIAATAAEQHLAVSLPYIADNYAGSHWLGSFALLALDA